MRSTLRHRASFVAVVAVAVLTPGPLARAGVAPNVPGGFATEVTQLANLAEAAAQVVVLGQQLANMVDQLDIARRNIMRTRPVWSDTAREIARFRGLVNQGRNLAYTAADLDAEFRRRYLGYDHYQRNRLENDTLAAKYDQWSRESNDSARAALRVAGLHSEQFATEESTIEALEQAGRTSDGQLQALQVGHQLASEQLRQSQKLRQLLMMQMQLQADYQAAEQDKHDLQRGQVRQFTAGPRPVLGNGTRF